MDKNKRIVELNGLRSCGSLTTVLGCDPKDLQKEVPELVTTTALQNSKIDDLQQRLTDPDILKDHFECQRRISELEAQLGYKNLVLEAEVERVKLLSTTCRELRDELQKKGIRPSLDARLNQLGFHNSSSENVGSSGASETSNSYEIGGTLLDFSAGCKKHPKLRLAIVTATVPPSALPWTAKNAYDLAQCLQVAENLQLSSETRTLFFSDNSSLA